MLCLKNPRSEVPQILLSWVVTSDLSGGAKLMFTLDTVGEVFVAAYCFKSTCKFRHLDPLREMIYLENGDRLFAEVAE